MCAALSALVSGCANGWPRVHHHHQVVNTECTPTGSKIARTDCLISQPTTSTSQGDLDQQGQQGMGSVQTPAASQGPR